MPAVSGGLTPRRTSSHETNRASLLGANVQRLSHEFHVLVAGSPSLSFLRSPSSTPIWEQESMPCKSALCPTPSAISNSNWYQVNFSQEIIVDAPSQPGYDNLTEGPAVRFCLRDGLESYVLLIKS